MHWSAVSAIARSKSVAASPWLLHSMRPISFKVFDRLIPEDDPQTKAAKEREAAIIKRKLQRSKFAEMYAAKQEKLFVASAALAAPTADAIFPSLGALPLVGPSAGVRCDVSLAFSTSQATLVTVAFQALGQAQLTQWLDAFASRFPDAQPLLGDNGGSRGGMQSPRLLNIVFLQGWFFRAFSPLITASTRRTLPPSVAAATAMVYEPSEKATDVSICTLFDQLLCMCVRSMSSAHLRMSVTRRRYDLPTPPSCQYICDALHVHNRVMCYLFLVDAGGHVRWRSVT